MGTGQVVISSLNSGSNGNCYYIGNEKDAVLIDAGISCRETEKRMKRLGLDMAKVRAVFISHEHTDHISGLPVLSKKYRLPVYITEITHRYSNLRLDPTLIRHFEPDQQISIGDLKVITFRKNHDAADPHSFVISSSSVNIGVFTDIGIACKQVTHYFRQCHAAFLESNYDTGMLMSGSYPKQLKKRISDGYGHISNDQALELFISARHPEMSHLVLSHLSANNNKPELVENLFAPHAGNTKIIVASRYEETPVLAIQAGRAAERLRIRTEKKPEQLKLF